MWPTEAQRGSGLLRPHSEHVAGLVGSRSGTPKPGRSTSPGAGTQVGWALAHQGCFQIMCGVPTP